MSEVPPDLPLIPAEPVVAAPPPTLEAATEAWTHAPDAPDAVRNPDGTFAAVTPASLTDAPTVPADPATTEPQPTASADDPTLYIEAKVGDEVLKLRKDMLIPTMRHGQVEYEPLEVVQRERMLKKDYDLGKQETKAERRQLLAERAALQHRAAAFEAEEARQRAALTDPAKFDEMQEHLRLMESSETYRRAHEGSQKALSYEAAEVANRTVQEQEIITDAVDTATQWIADSVGRHPGVEMAQIQAEFGRALAARQPGVDFSPESIERFVAQRAQPAAALTAPLQTQLEAQKAEMAQLRAELAALRTSKTTDHALNRARTIPTAPAGGAAPIPGAKVLTTPNGKRDLDSLTDAWRRS